MKHTLLRLAAFAAATFSAVSAHGGQPKVGDTFPVLADYKLEGTLPDTTGKVVVVDFWASWCGPCKASFPAFRELHEKFADKGVVIVAVSIDEDQGAMEGFLKKAKVPFVAVRDAKQKLTEKLSIESIPTTFILGRDGKIAALHNGYGGDSTKRELFATVEKLLKP
ncbi:MAG: TlpA disulfide reductase family protein [Verrucomicrobiota bacterium]